MGAANVVQSGLRRGPSIQVIALIAVLGAAVATVRPGGDRRHHHGHHRHAAYVPTPVAVPPPLVESVPVEPVVTPAPADDGDPCPAALAAWAAVRNHPDVPSGTIQLQRVRLRNLAIEACRAPHQP